MSLINLKTAAALTGLSQRTLWRYVNKGVLSPIRASIRGGRTLFDLDKVLPLAQLTLDPEDKTLILNADQGDPAAQCELGLLLLSAERLQSALYWLEQAAAQLHPDAMYILGRYYLAGDLAPPNPEKGINLLSYAAIKGHPLARALVDFLRSESGQAAFQNQAPALCNRALDDIERQLLLRVLADTATTP